MHPKFRVLFLCTRNSDRETGPVFPGEPVPAAIFVRMPIERLALPFIDSFALGGEFCTL